MSDLPKVMVGGPVRDREWSVPAWLGSLVGLDYPPERLTLAVLVNDSVDETFSACYWWARQAHYASFGRTSVVDRTFGTQLDNNQRSCRDYLAFALARDAWTRLRRDEEWLLQVDSDVQVTPETLRRLLYLAKANSLRALAGVVDNTCGGALEWYRNVLQRQPNGRYYHCPEAHLRRPGVYPCAMTGALILLHASLFDEGHCYAGRMTPDASEDSAFCEGLLEAGVVPHYAPEVIGTHWMMAPKDLGYLRDSAWHKRLAEYHRARAQALKSEV